MVQEQQPNNGDIVKRPCSPGQYSTENTRIGPFFLENLLSGRTQPINPPHADRPAEAPAGSMELGYP
jgi:hypothetical protein